MKQRSLLPLLFAALLIGWHLPLSAQTVAPAKPAFKEIFADRNLLAKLRKGGYVLYLRHGYTDNSRPDQFPNVDLADCNTQRLLNDQGRALMREVGKSLLKAKIPLGEIIVSPMCRTLESAKLAIGDKFETDEALMYSANMTHEEKLPRLQSLKKLLAAPIAPGSNRLLLAHAPNLADLIGFFVKPEGTVVVFSQSGPEGYEYVASIPPMLWEKLLTP